ncbi:hypothetical protein LTS17_009492 [Exophiala oligosperma]
MSLSFQGGPISTSRGEAGFVGQAWISASVVPFRRSISQLNSLKRIAQAHRHSPIHHSEKQRYISQLICHAEAANILLKASSDARVVTPLTRKSIRPSREVVSQAIGIYFDCCHRQPLWLFDPGDSTSLSPDSNEELIFAVLSLSTQYKPDRFASGQVQSAHAYGDAARSLVMLRITNASTSLPTLQALTLLAFYYLVCDDLALAAFHATLVRSLLQCCGLDLGASTARTVGEDQRQKLFWSVFLLDSMCGLPLRVPSIIDDVGKPRFLAIRGMLQHTSTACPELPKDKESYTEQDERCFGMWAHMVRMASVWGEVRVFVSRCTDGQIKAPWHSDSEYAQINAQLLDMETTIPSFYRYDVAKFPERDEAEIVEKKAFWLPWVRLQITYHTIHSVINHPFLYSSKASMPRPGANAFWRTSSELALLHSTWIARLIGMATNKGLELADPFFAHSAAVAATLHSYWARASDGRIRGPAVRNLQLCRSFISDIGAHWRLCRSIEDTLDQLISLALPTTQQQQGQSTSITTNTALMQKILDFAAPQGSSFSGEGLFHLDFVGHVRSRRASWEDTTVVNPDIHAMPSDVHNTTGHYAPPPDWFSPQPAAPTSAGLIEEIAGSPPEAQAEQAEAARAENQQRWQIENLPELSNWSWGPDDANITYDPWTQFYDRSGPNSGWWDFGNL